MLFGKDFKRDREGKAPNSLLNYGYSILRAATTRALLGAGLLPALGVFHRNRYNSFPLADDLMEPFRPYVDEIAYCAMEENYTEIDKETKARMFRLLCVDVSIANVVRPLQLALTISAASLVKYYKGEIKTLSLPLFK
jgi:CRISPR-associated protein Cas1